MPHDVSPASPAAAITTLDAHADAMRDASHDVEAEVVHGGPAPDVPPSALLDAIGQLAGGVAHDFNNLLTVIAGYAETLLDSFEPGDPRVDDVEEIRAAAERAAALTQQLLAFSGRQLLNPEPLDAATLVREVAGQAARVLGPDVALSLDLAPGPAPILVDRVQLERALLDLVENARNAMPGGGRLVLATAVEPERVVVGSRAPGSSSAVVLSVTDSGAGIAGDLRARIFEPFVSTRTPAERRGLGLATVYGIVKQSGGSIAVTSEAGRGARFEIRLPLAAPPAGTTP